MKTGRLGSGRELNELEIVHRFAVDMLQSNNLNDLLWSIVENVGQLLDFEDFTLYLCEGDRLYQRATHGAQETVVRTLKNPIVVELGEGIVGEVAKSARAGLSPDSTAQDHHAADEEAARSNLTVPVKYDGPPC